MPEKLTQGFVNSELIPGKYRDSELKGFCLNVTSNVKTYFVHARIKNQKLVTRVIGRHNDPWTERQARSKATEWLLMLRQGIDPYDLIKERAEKAEQKEAELEREKQRAELTLRVVFETWVNDRSSKKTRLSTKALYKHVLFKHLVDWLDMPIHRITEKMVSDRYDQVVKVTVSSAGNTFRALRMLCNWAINKYGIDCGLMSNPVTVLSKNKEWEECPPKKEIICQRELSTWFKTVSATAHENYRDFLILALLTGLRKETELGSLRWENVDFDAGYFTAPDTKNGRPHTLPLTFVTAGILKRRYEQRASEVFVFPTVRSPKGHVTDVREHIERITELCGVEFYPHALRRTFGSACSALVSEATKKRLLNHISKADVSQHHYDVHELSELKRALELVEQRLMNYGKVTADELIGATVSGGNLLNVVPLKKGLTEKTRNVRINSVK